MGDKVAPGRRGGRGRQQGKRMEIAIHLGVHLTDEDRLIRCLMRNRAALLRHGIAVPGTGRYRGPLRRIAHAMRDQPTDAETQEALLDGIISEDEVSRVVLSSDCFMANHRWAVSKGQFYPAGAEKAAGLRRLFPAAKVEFFLALRNPASLLPALIADPRSGGAEQVLADTDPLTPRWSALLAAMTEAVPGARITVWRHEDAPLLWPEILRELADHPDDLVLNGTFEALGAHLTDEGLALMSQWLTERPAMTDAQRRRVLRAFLEKFARPAATAEPAPLPGLNPDQAVELHEVMSALYEQDIDLIAQLPGIDFLEP